MKNEFYIAGIGASTGGLSALKDFFSHVPVDPGASFIVICDFPKKIPTYLDTILSNVTKVPVELLSKNTLVLPDHVYVLPGHLRVKIVAGELLVRETEPHESTNTAIDEFLFSLARDQKDKAVAIILSGMGQDGAEGSKVVHKEGGIVLVQDPDSTVYQSKPISAIKADGPQAILRPRELGIMLTEIIKSRKVRPGINQLGI